LGFSNEEKIGTIKIPPRRDLWALRIRYFSDRGYRGHVRHGPRDHYDGGVRGIPKSSSKQPKQKSATLLVLKNAFS